MIVKTYNELELAKMKADRDLLDRRIQNMEESVEPEKIQGYTREEWQEIIDGGYLCEVRDSEEEGWYEGLVVIKSITEIKEFKAEYGFYRYCRPAQTKGVMRPIFVEPVDKKAKCHFFNKADMYLGAAHQWKDYTNLSNHCLSAATKYIEV
jgi:hypothetical protein